MRHRAAREAGPSSTKPPCGESVYGSAPHVVRERPLLDAANTHRRTSSMFSRQLATLIGSVILAVAAACNLPRDSGGTLDHIRHGTMRVGLITNPPWVTDSGSAADGVEQQLVKELASRLDARVDWVRRPEAELLEALHRRELDLVVGGLTSTLPWQKEVAFTRPYYTDTIAVGAPAGNGVPSILKGSTVAVERGSAIAAELRTRDATPL